MEWTETLKENCQKQCSIKWILRIFGTASKEEVKCPSSTLTNKKAMAVILNWLAWHGESEKQIELRMVEPWKQTYMQLILQKGAIYVRYVHNAPELVNKMLHHWNSRLTYQTLSVQDVEDSVGRADILNMLDTVCNTNEDISDFDLEL